MERRDLVLKETLVPFIKNAFKKVTTFLMSNQMFVKSGPFLDHEVMFLDCFEKRGSLDRKVGTFVCLHSLCPDPWPLMRLLVNRISDTEKLHMIRALHPFVWLPLPLPPRPL